MRNDDCNKCGQKIKKVKNTWKCVNLGCVNYNKQVRRNRASNKEGEEEEIPIEKKR
tara:strand:- start:5280 stop:5447 length:168 start_codon:yes stop_codon:yes gene_type:complete